MAISLPHFARSVVVAFCCSLLLVGPYLETAYAMPNAPGVVPDRVGQFQEARDVCNLDGMPLPSWLTELIFYLQSKGCNDSLDHIDAAFDSAYLSAESAVATPGFPTNDIHPWAGVLVQDFSGGALGDGWGAIVAKSHDDGLDPQKPYYIGGGMWHAYVRAVNEQNIQPGYPINMQHAWPGSDISIQDFRGGSWGDAAIIGGDSAWLVAGRHWEAYWTVEGQIRLGNPVGPWFQNADGWYEQDFEGGRILELDHNVTIEFNDGSQSEQLYIE